MKRIILFILIPFLLSLIVACSGITTPDIKMIPLPDTGNTNLQVLPEAQILRSSGVIEFHVGTERLFVFDNLGNPDFIFYGNDQTWPVTTRDADAYHVYSDIGLSFRIFGDEVKEITLLNDDWIGSNGLMVGLTITEALSILGNDYDYRDFPGKDFYDFPDIAIMIEVSDSTDRILEINIQEGNRVLL